MVLAPAVVVEPAAAVVFAFVAAVEDEDEDERAEIPPHPEP